ncbi:shikimate dehydrogenase [Candidatus Woesearchaeota archaeon]|nr:shikimate dehydrogenase [Candidatus Woesearchaeota archaeon]
MLAAVITEKNFENVSKVLKEIKAADLVELRLDYLREIELSKLKNMIKNCNKPVMVTNRKIGEGGFFNGSEEERIQILKKAADFGAGFVDIEYSSDKNSIKGLIKNKKNSKIIVSCHNFEKTPDNLNVIYNKIKTLNPDIIKIVTKASSVKDNFKIFELINAAKKENQKITAFCMGPYGQFSRVLGAILGSHITYASIGKGKESASGQMTINEMTDLYRIKNINKNTKIAGLIGNPVGHSWSHIIHNAGFGEFGINAVYLKFRVDKLKEFVEYSKKLNVVGFSVTIPYKIRIMGYLDEIDEKAKKIGAVNTIAARNGKYVGYNADCDGAMLALKSKTKLKGKNVVLLGAGGSARAIAYGLKEENANVTILNRTARKAKAIADKFKFDYGPLGKLKNADYDILINATSAGMHPEADKSPVEARLIKKGAVFFDIVFNPYKTKLLKDAEKKKCIIIPGTEMLINQAVLQFELWTGRAAPKEAMREKMMDCIKNDCHKN